MYESSEENIQIHLHGSLMLAILFESAKPSFDFQKTIPAVDAVYLEIFVIVPKKYIHFLLLQIHLFEIWPACVWAD